MPLNLMKPSFPAILKKKKKIMGNNEDDIEWYPAANESNKWIFILIFFIFWTPTCKNGLCLPYYKMIN